MKSVGFIGLGTMGHPMAKNLLAKGYPLTVYNRTPEKAEDLVSQGAELAASPAEVARSSDVVFTNVSNDAALNEVILGSDGVLEGVHPGLTVIDCSTVSPATSRSIAEELAGHFAGFLDAPVTGSKPAAEAGTLVFMIGGTESLLDEHRDLFEVLGSKIVYMGPSGAGSYTKLAHNAIVGINSAALAEGMTFAAKAGLDPEKFLSVVQAGSAGSKQADLKGQRIIDRDFSAQFSLQLMLKDLLLATRETGGFQLPTPLLNTAAGLYQMGLAKGLGTQDLSSVVQCYEDWAQLKVAKRPSEAAVGAGRERRRSDRVNIGIRLRLSIYQWEQEGAFSGQTIEGLLHDLSENGLQLGSEAPLAQDMFVVIHFPKEAELPPITGKIVRIEPDGSGFRYGCMLSGLSPVIRVKLEKYIQARREERDRLDSGK